MVVDKTSPTYPSRSSFWTNSTAGAWRACNPTTVRTPRSAARGWWCGGERSGGGWAVAAWPGAGLTTMRPTLSGGAGRGRDEVTSSPRLRGGARGAGGDALRGGGDHRQLQLAQVVRHVPPHA